MYYCENSTYIIRYNTFFTNAMDLRFLSENFVITHHLKEVGVFSTEININLTIIVDSKSTWYNNLTFVLIAKE